MTPETQIIPDCTAINLEVLRQLLSLGFSIIPSGKPITNEKGVTTKKAPWIPWVEYEKHPPTEKDLEQWLKQYKPSLWGIVTGPISGIVVFDADSPETIKLMDDAGLTAHVITRRGKHYYFPYIGEKYDNLVHTMSGIIPHVDIRAKGGFVNFLGNNDLASYNVAVVPVKDKLNDYKKLPKEVIVAIGKLQANLASGDPKQPIGDKITTGNRNHSLTRIAGALRHLGMSKEQIESNLLNTNITMCDPPLPESEVRAIAKSVSRYKPGKQLEEKPVVKVSTLVNSTTALDNTTKTKIQKYLCLGIPKPDISAMITGWKLNGTEALALQYLNVATPEDSENQTAEKAEGIPVLPEDAWTGLFAKYRALVGCTTEASDSFHYGDFLVVLGCTMAHRISAHYAGKIYPNFYVCNIGRTGETRKSTAANRAKSLLNKLNYSDEDDENTPFQILNGIGSIEALYDSLTGRKKVRLIYYSELGSLMAKAQQSGTSNMITDLTTLWDMPDRINPSTRHIRVNCEYPFVSILACSTLEWLYKYISLENIYSGFANRWNFVYGEPKSPMPNPPPVNPDDEKALVKDINSIRKWAMELPNEGLLPKSKEANEMWELWYIDYFNEHINSVGLLPELMIRIPVFAWKIALLYAAQDYSYEIRGKDLDKALRVSKFLEQSMRLVFRGYSSTESRKKEDRLLDYLKKKGPTSNRDIYKNLNMSADELNKISRPLISMGLLNIVRIGNKDMLKVV